MAIEVLGAMIRIPTWVPVAGVAAVIGGLMMAGRKSRGGRE
jgi:hypothetical protein